MQRQADQTDWPKIYGQDEYVQRHRQEGILADNSAVSGMFEKLGSLDRLPLTVLPLCTASVAHPTALKFSIQVLCMCTLAKWILISSTHVKKHPSFI